MMYLFRRSVFCLLSFAILGRKKTLTFNSYYTLHFTSRPCFFSPNDAVTIDGEVK
jgi:hypothetical protein